MPQEWCDQQLTEHDSTVLDSWKRIVIPLNWILALRCINLDSARECPLLIERKS
jgi:hypothetical protein